MLQLQAPFSGSQLLLRTEGGAGRKEQEKEIKNKEAEFLKWKRLLEKKIETTVGDFENCLGLCRTLQAQNDNVTFFL